MATLWNVRHRWPAGARFAFNCYRHWAQLLLRHPGEPPVIILSREGVSLSYPLSTQDYNWRLPRMAEEKLRPMPITIESEPRPCRPAVLKIPQHCQAAQIVEPITGINEHIFAWICILSEELKFSHCPLSTFTLFLSLAIPILFHLHGCMSPPPPFPPSLCLNYLIASPLPHTPPLPTQVLPSLPPPILDLSPYLVASVPQNVWLPLCRT